MLELRPAYSRDAEIISRIVRESYAEQAETLQIDFAKYPNFISFESPEMVELRMAGGDQVVLAYLDNLPIGTVSFRVLPGQPDRAHIKRFAILPRFRKKGYGPRLMEYAETSLRKLGVKEVEIASVAAFTRLRKYYEGLGYRAAERKSFPTVPFEVQFMDKLLK